MTAHTDKGEPEADKLIDLRESSNPFFRALGPQLEKLLQLDRVNAHYHYTQREDVPGNYFEKSMDTLQLSYQLTDEDRERIPTTGPVFVLSNHPYGGIDGVALGALLTSVRQDVRLLVNYLLYHIETMRPWIYVVDPFGGKEAAKANLRGIRQSLKWLKEGGMLATFPSGTVSHFHWRRRIVTDPPWNENVAGMIRKTKCAVLPVYIMGRNSALFQAAGMIHPRLRTAMLPREMLRRCGSSLEIRVGHVISPSMIAKHQTDAALMEFLRLKTDILKNRPHEGKARRFVRFPRLVPRKIKQAELIAPVDPQLLQREVQQLPEECLMVNLGKFSVFVARAEQIPHILEELGRLREKTFREVGEGTGQNKDLDVYDVYYRHLFMWNSETREIVGAYRLGMTDEILERYGSKGLYTTTLFKFKPKVFKRINPAIELGRSFIRSEYQKKHVSLSLIWRGIGEYIVRNPRYRVVFGPVSISKDYQALSKDLIVQFLKGSRTRSEFSPLVKGRHPHRPRHLSRTDRKRLLTAVQDIDDVSALISEIETDNKGVPVLLRQYLKLNAELLSFNIDREFSHVVDGLILIDLMTSDPKILSRFFGDEGYASFARYQRSLDKSLARETEAEEAVTAKG